MASPGNRFSRCNWIPAIHKHGIAVDDLAVAVDEQRAIAVAIERDAQPRRRINHRFLQQVEVCRSAVQIDVAPIRSVADDHEVKAEATEEIGSDCRRRAVGAVDHDTAARQPLHSREDLQQVVDVTAAEIAALDRGAAASGDG